MVVIHSDENLFYIETYVNRQTDMILTPVNAADPSIQIVCHWKTLPMSWFWKQ